jgi:hypothetical protein
MVMTTEPSAMEEVDPVMVRDARLRLNWRPKVQWFAAEFLVVVTGVLVALALNAWWAERQDRHSEEAYLRQLVNDAGRNEDLLQHALAEDSASLIALVHLSAALRAGEPPRESAMEIMGVALRYSDPRPVLGIFDHLIGSGRVELLRTDSLRLALIEYTSLMHSDLAELSRHVDLLLLSMRLWISHQQAAGLDCAMFVEEEGILHTACDQEVQRVWSGLARDPEYRAAVLGARISAWNRVFYLERMVRDTRRFRTLLERELGVRSPGAS